MKKTFIFLGIALTFACIALTSHAQWQLVWSDEFNSGSTPNTGLWRYDVWAPYRVNNELQAYTTRTENCRVSGGNLILEGRHDWGNGYEYTSARLNSTAGWTYGRMEARMKLPGGWGSWPAFWLYPDNEAIYGWNAETNYWWPNCGEIDIMEEVGYDVNRIHASVHSSNFYFKKGNQRTGNIVSNNVTSTFKVYACEWYADRIDFFVDGTKFFTVWNDYTGWQSWPFNHNFHIILNLAIGGDWGGAQGVDPNIWPRQLLVDYVRVYKQQASNVWTITMRGNNNLYVSSENGTAVMKCNRATAGGWEKFDVVDAGSGKIALKGTNGKYVSSENGTAAMTCNRASIGGWEAFTWVDLGNSQFALMGSNGKYVSSANGAASGMTCNSAVRSTWETFTWATTTKSAEIAEFKQNTEFNVFPSPATDVLNIESNLENYSVELYDLSGKLQMQENNLNSTSVLHVSDLNSGIYLVKVIGNSEVLSRKIIIE